MNYWLDLFTGTTWKEYRDAGAGITGFRESQRKSARRVKPGDVFLCYLTGVMRWVGALEIVGPSDDTTSIWSVDEFPVRFEVRPLVVLEPEHGVPMDQLEGKVSFFEDVSDRGKFKGIVRRSLNLIKEKDDGEVILRLLREADASPIHRPVDPRKLARKPMYRAEQRKGKTKTETLVTVPETEQIEEIAVPPIEASGEDHNHTEIQHALVALGADLGLEVWVARNDRGRSWNGQVLGEMPGVVSELPTQFNEATHKTIELIDVLWLRGNSYVAAFEVECTTAVYSGLLRMSDLLALQPNLDIKLYIVAPDRRRDKVQDEILRPTFMLRQKPLSKVCGYLSFSVLMEKVTGIQRLGLAGSLKPEFLTQTAEFFGDDSEI